MCLNLTINERYVLVLQSVPGSSMMPVPDLCCVDEMHRVYSRWSRSLQQVPQGRNARCAHWLTCLFSVRTESGREMTGEKQLSVF